MPRIIAVTSGKGRAGKSNLALNLGIALGMMNNRVQILDTDVGPAKIDALLGINPRWALEDVVHGKADVEDLIIRTEYKVELIPARSGMQEITDITKPQVDKLIKAISESSRHTDFLLVDTDSGISTAVISLLMAVPEVIVGVSPEANSLTEAYALIKVLKKNGFEGRLSMFASMVKDSASGRMIYRKISSAVQRFLDTHVGYVGCVCVDEKLIKAVAEHEPVIVRFPTADVSRCYRVIATTILSQQSAAMDCEKFWTRLLRLIIKTPKPEAMRSASYNGENKASSLETTIQHILDEQRRTRLLLERLLHKIDQGPLDSEFSDGPII
ncbi:MAG: P-loop NTPase [Deltaproteobacteria bacterium]|nr:P-loop NTPase [Deltaproteobacteria bacterium]